VSDRRCFVAAFSAATLSLACFFIITLDDAFNTFRDGLVIVRAARLAMLPPAKEDGSRITSVVASRPDQSQVASLRGYAR
jgi:hypothetical protein